MRNGAEASKLAGSAKSTQTTNGVAGVSPHSS